MANSLVQWYAAAERWEMQGTDVADLHKMGQKRSSGDFKKKNMQQKALLIQAGLERNCCSIWEGKREEPKKWKEGQKKNGGSYEIKGLLKWEQGEREPGWWGAGVISG